VMYIDERWTRRIEADVKNEDEARVIARESQRVPGSVPFIYHEYVEPLGTEIEEWEEDIHLEWQGGGDESG